MGRQLAFLSLSLDDDRELLAEWLSSDRCPYHSDDQLSHEEVNEMTLLNPAKKGGFRRVLRKSLVLIQFHQIIFGCLELRIGFYSGFKLLFGCGFLALGLEDFTQEVVRQGSVADFLAIATC
jgi:hypothetical protein